MVKLIRECQSKLKSLYPILIHEYYKAWFVKHLNNQ